MSFNVNFKVFFKLMKVHLLVSELYKDLFTAKQESVFLRFRYKIFSGVYCTHGSKQS